jgi:cation transport ATPase
MTDLDVTFNRCEATLWFVISALFALHAAITRARGRSVSYAQVALIAAFAAFGVSDIIESFTRAWWRPWWLFFLKAICIVTFLVCYLVYRRARTRIGRA